MLAFELVAFCAIIVGGFACQWLAWRLKLPAILFLLFAGILAGPLLGWLDPDVLLGELLTPLVSIAVAIILFEGSLTLKFSELRGHGSVVRNLVTVGVVITGVLGCLAAYYLLQWDIYLSALFGAIVTVSGPTVVMPLLRAVRPSATVSSILRWESILIDPLGAILALLVFDVIVATRTGSGFAHVAQITAVIVFAGSALGMAGGYLFGVIIRRRLVPDLLRDFAALAAVLGVFAIAETVQSESGLLAVTVMGVWLANMHGVEIEDIHAFKESVTLLLISGLFILLAAKLDIGDLLSLGSGALLVLVVLQLAAGPLRAAISSAGSGLKWREVLFVGWVFPRGIVAAAISSLFTLRLVEFGYPDAEKLVPLVFSVIIGTVIVQSLTARPVAHLLNVAAPEPTGVLVVGANRVAQMLAKSLQDAGKSVRVADSHWASIRRARMAGLPVFYGNAASGYAETNLNLDGLGTLLAASRRPGLNELTCIRYAREFGRDRVYILGNYTERQHDKHKVSGETRGRILFDGEQTIDSLMKLIRGGAEPRITLLTDAFSFEDYQSDNPGSMVLYAIDTGGLVRFPVGDEDFEPGSGWSVAALNRPREAED